MGNPKKLEKVRILEKDFPAKIPEDIGSKLLEVVNDAGETVALFFNTSFIKLKFTDPMKYIKHHDDIFNYWDVYHAVYMQHLLSDEDGDPDDWEEEIRNGVEQMELGPAFDWGEFEMFGYFGRAMIALCRLTYPYHLRYSEKIEHCLNIVKDDEFFESTGWTVEGFPFEDYLGDPKYDGFCKLVFACSDTKLILEYMKRYVKLNRYFDTLFECCPAEILYEQPELFFTAENIEPSIEMANVSKKTELLAFLLDYKNKHFKYDSGAHLKLTL